MCAYMCMCACVWTGDECVMNQVRRECVCIYVHVCMRVDWG